MDNQRMPAAKMSDPLNLLEAFLSSAWKDAAVWFGGLWAILLFIRKVFRDADEELSPNKREILANKLAHSEEWASGSWVPDFVLVFDRFFGKNHLSLRCFRRSAAVSIGSFLIVWGFVGDLGTRLDRPSGLGDYLMLVPVVGLHAIVLNLIVDYVSLLETRILLNAKLNISFTVALDFVLTGLITLSWISFVGWLFFRNTSSALPYLSTFRDVWQYLIGELNHQPLRSLVLVPVATSYTTSVWLWLHGLAQVVIRGLRSAAFVISWLDAPNKPLRAIGTTINVFLALLGVSLFPVYLVAG